MKEIWFIRHGESETNVGLITANPKDVKLTEKGELQAQKLVSIFKEKPDLFITSPFLRTKQTAAPTLAKFSDVPVEEWQIQEFSYLNPITWANSNSSMRADRTKEYWSNCDPFYNDGDGVESFADLIERVYNTIDLLKNCKEKFIVLFCHGQFIKTLWYLLQDLHQHIYRSGTYIIFNEQIIKDLMKNIDHFIRAIQFNNTDILKIKVDNDNNVWLNTDYVWLENIV